MTADIGETGCGRCFTEGEMRLVRSPDVPLPVELVRQVAQKEPGHWDDQAAVIRRVLPQLVLVLAGRPADPELMARGPAAAGWSEWPGEQAASVAGFLDAWWPQTLRTASPPTPAAEVFASCVTASSTVTPWLARREAELEAEAETGPVAGHHLDECADRWREELHSGTSPFWWWWGSPAQERAAWQEVTLWLAGRGRPQPVPGEAGSTVGE
ncbi:hypothetical protein ACIQWA_29515 [Kitasatospora sp. NPDC098652]|uniref:hypothetical protein n=1 Tax=Kitasatospora sp. NPDC098652 TaxID=3364095 RepID=UPI00380CE39F